MRLPIDPREELRRLAERLPVGSRTPVGQGLAAFDDVPCARIPRWRKADERSTPRP